MRVKILGIVLFLGLAACSGNFLTTEGLDKSCTTADDCVAVLVGNRCDCACQFDAINKDQVETYRAQSKDDVVCGTECVACIQPRLSCVSGQCRATDS